MFVGGGDLAFFSKTSADYLFIIIFLYEMFDSLQLNLQCNFNLAVFVWPIFKIRQFFNVPLILFVMNKFHEVEILMM